MKLAEEELIYILRRIDLVRGNCIEINFYLEEDEQYTDCWLGKMQDRRKKGKEIYWFGFTEDGSQAYDFYNLDEFLHAKVFDGKDLLGVLHKTNWEMLDGSEFEEMLRIYHERD